MSPRKLARPWTCTSSCNLEGKGKDCSGRRVTGKAKGRSQEEACKEAKRDATQKAPRDCYARHCQCDCSQTAGTALLLFRDALALLPPGERRQFRDISISALEGILGSRADASVRATACWILGRSAPAASTAVLRLALRDRHAQVRAVAARAIAERGDTRAEDVAVLAIMALRDPHSFVRRAATFALGMSGLSAALRPLVRILRDPTQSALIRGTAAEALADLHDSHALVPLMRGARVSSPSVRFWSIYALGELGTPAVLPMLAEIARTDRARVARWGSLAAAARRAEARVLGRQARG